MGFRNVKQIRVDHTKCGSGNSTSFPVLFSGTYGYLATVANGGYVVNTVSSNGQTIPADLGFYSDSACTVALPFEVASYTASSGQIEAHVQVATLSSSVDTVFYMGFGDVSATADISGFGSGTKPWDSNFKAVYHFGTTASGTIAALNDSTSNANNLTQNGTATAVAGEVGAAAVNLASASSQWLTKASPTGVSFLDGSACTIAAWIKTGTGTSSVIVGTLNYQSTAGMIFGFGDQAANKLDFYLTDANVANYRHVYGSTNIADSAWHRVVITYSGNGSTSGMQLYLDGATETTTTDTNNSPGTLNNSNLYIGKIAGTVPEYVNGSMDEVQISNVARDANWVKADYNMGVSPSTFYSIVPGLSLNNYLSVKAASGMSVTERIR